MTVKDFIQRHPNDTLDLMTPNGYVLLSPELSQRLLEGKPIHTNAGVSGTYLELPSEELLRQEICEIAPDKSLSGYFHMVTDSQPPENAVRLEHIDLSSCTLVNTDLSGVCFDGAKFRGTKFDHVNLSGCTFLDCDFSECDLYLCDLHNSTAVNCDFTCSIWEEGNTKGLRLQDCDMEAVSLYNVDLDHVTADERTMATSQELRDALALAIDYSKLRPLTQKRVDVMAANHALWVNDAGGAQANFSGCLLHGINMKGMQLNNAVFDSAVIESSDLSNAGLCFSSFEVARFVDCNLEGCQAEEANFRDAIFRNCDLRDAQLTHSNLSRSKFLSSELRDMDIQNSCVEGSNLEGQGNWGIHAANVSFNEYVWTQEPSEGMTGMGGISG